MFAIRHGENDEYVSLFKIPSRCYRTVLKNIWRRRKRWGWQQKNDKKDGNIKRTRKEKHDLFIGITSIPVWNQNDVKLDSWKMFVVRRCSYCWFSFNFLPALQTNIVNTRSAWVDGVGGDEIFAETVVNPNNTTIFE